MSRAGIPMWWHSHVMIVLVSSLTKTMWRCPEYFSNVFEITFTRRFSQWCGGTCLFPWFCSVHCQNQISLVRQPAKCFVMRRHAREVWFHMSHTFNHQSGHSVFFFHLHGHNACCDLHCGVWVKICNWMTQGEWIYLIAELKVRMLEPEECQSHRNCCLKIVWAWTAVPQKLPRLEAIHPVENSSNHHDTKWSMPCTGNIFTWKHCKQGDMVCAVVSA